MYKRLIIVFSFKRHPYFRICIYELKVNAIQFFGLNSKEVHSLSYIVCVLFCTYVFSYVYVCSLKE